MIGGDVMGADATRASMDSAKGGPPLEIKSLAQVSLRQTQAPQHQRPSLGNMYKPTPAPGSTISVVRKKILKRQESMQKTADADAEGVLESPVAPRINTAGSNSVKFVDNDNGVPTLPASWVGGGEENNFGIARGLLPGETPRSQWRRQFWLRNTPWGTDRKIFGGEHFYETPIKSSVRNYNNSSRWEHDPKIVPTGNSEDIIRQIVYKLEQHCNTTFALTRAFKIFDRDMSSSIDKVTFTEICRSEQPVHIWRQIALLGVCLKHERGYMSLILTGICQDEMRAVLITFSIDLSDMEIDQLMDDFGGMGRG